MVEIDLHEIFDNLEIGIVIIDSNAIIKNINKQCLEWCLLNKIDVLDQSLDELIKKGHFTNIYNNENFICNKKNIGRYTLITVNKVGFLGNTTHFNYQKTQDKIIAFNRKMVSIVNFAMKVAQTNVTILITGESGTGKDLLARFIHNASRIRNAPFVEINCATIPDNLFETELFGYNAGAFSGANPKGKKGLVEEADKGTLFLNEIGELPLNMQAKLLTILQQKQFTKVGATKPVEVDVRIIAATNKNLKKMVEQKQFREDLYYRLDVISINIPPLRERKEDIEPLVLHLVDRFNEKYGLNKIITQDLISYLKNLPWKGNVRELENQIEKLFFSTESNKLTKKDVTFNSETEDKNANNLKDLYIDFEKEVFIKALSVCKTTRQLSKYLGVSQATVVRKLKKYNLK